jgi:hypothetical protein
MSDLADLVATATREEMVRSGWRADADRDRFELGSFRRRVPEDFSATVLFHRRSMTFPARATDELDLVARVGVSFEPAYRVWSVVLDRA